MKRPGRVCPKQVQPTPSYQVTAPGPGSFKTQQWVIQNRPRQIIPSYPTLSNSNIHPPPPPPTLSPSVLPHPTPSLGNVPGDSVRPEGDGSSHAFNQGNLKSACRSHLGVLPHERHTESNNIKVIPVDRRHMAREMRRCLASRTPAQGGASEHTQYTLLER